MGTASALPMPTKVVIEVIDHAAQRYATVGDYVCDADGTLRIFVSKTKTPVFAWCVAVHELIEAILTTHAGIADSAITAFDHQFEEEAARGAHAADEEPGADPRCPYVRQHTTAENCERIMVLAAGINYEHEYDPELTKLWNTTRQ